MTNKKNAGQGLGQGAGGVSSNEGMDGITARLSVCSFVRWITHPVDERNRTHTSVPSVRPSTHCEDRDTRARVGSETRYDAPSSTPASTVFPPERACPRRGREPPGLFVSRWTTIHDPLKKRRKDSDNGITHHTSSNRNT